VRKVTEREKKTVECLQTEKRLSGNASGELARWGRKRAPGPVQKIYRNEQEGKNLSRHNRTAPRDDRQFSGPTENDLERLR